MDWIRYPLIPPMDNGEYLCRVRVGALNLFILIEWEDTRWTSRGIEDDHEFFNGVTHYMVLQAPFDE